MGTRAIKAGSMTIAKQALPNQISSKAAAANQNQTTHKRGGGRAALNMQENASPMG